MEERKIKEEEESAVMLESSLHSSGSFVNEEAVRGGRGVVTVSHTANEPKKTQFRKEHNSDSHNSNNKTLVHLKSIM